MVAAASAVSRASYTVAYAGLTCVAPRIAPIAGRSDAVAPTHWSHLCWFRTEPCRCTAECCCIVASGFPSQRLARSKLKNVRDRMYNLRRGPGLHLRPACTRRDCTSRNCDRTALTHVGTDHVTRCTVGGDTLTGPPAALMGTPSCSRVALVKSGAVARHRLYRRRRWRAGDRDPDKATTGAPKPLPFPR